MRRNTSGASSSREFSACKPRDGINHVCPFSAIIFKGETARMGEDGCVGETHEADGLRRKASRSHVAVGIMADALINGVLDIRGFRPPNDDDGAANKPTTGFYALVMLALSCKSLRLYGFSGSTSADEHVITGDHNINGEHQLIHAISPESPANPCRSPPIHS